MCCYACAAGQSGQRLNYLLSRYLIPIIAIAEIPRVLRASLPKQSGLIPTLSKMIYFQGFDHHVRQEHNMWSYIFFFIHLNGTKVNDYTALEMYVYKLVCVIADV